jgi:hypothetical protein
MNVKIGELAMLREGRMSQVAMIWSFLSMMCNDVAADTVMATFRRNFAYTQDISHPTCQSGRYPECRLLWASAAAVLLLCAMVLGLYLPKTLINIVTSGTRTPAKRKPRAVGKGKSLNILPF